MTIAPAPALVYLLPFLTFAGVLWALIVWRGESGDARRYHWSLPVSHAAHDLARTLAGAVWLIACLAFLCALGLVLAATDGSWYIVEGLWPAWWANVFTAPIVVYLFCSLFPLLTTRPLEWMIGAFVVGFCVLILAGSGRVVGWGIPGEVVGDWIESVLYGGYRGWGEDRLVELRYSAAYPGSSFGRGVPVTQFAVSTTIAYGMTLSCLAGALTRRR